MHDATITAIPETLRAIATRRLRAIPVAPGRGLPDNQRFVVLSELAAMGYRVSDPAVLEQVDPSAFERAYPQIISELRKLRGGDVDYVPLFGGFPDDVPDGDEYFVKRVVGYLVNWIGLVSTEEGPRLSSGAIVPEWLFDLEQFGADPITQLQDPDLYERGRAKQDARRRDEHVEWLSMAFVLAPELEERLQGWLRATLYSKASIADVVRPDIRTLLEHFGPESIDPKQVVFRETRTFLLEHFWKAREFDIVVALVGSPTDLLRLFASLTESDVSLATPVRYPRLNRAQRRVVLTALESCGNLEEDLLRYRGLWIAVSRGLHPGTPANQNAYPKASEALHRLQAGEIASFESTTNRLLGARKLSELMVHLSTRPGVFARRLHEVLRAFSTRAKIVMDAFAAVAERVPVKNLLVMHAYFSGINDAENRFVTNKRGSVHVLPNTSAGALSAATITAACNMLRGALLAQLAGRESWEGQSVWVDPALCDIMVPLQQRAASDGVLTLGRGSRIPVDFDKVLRLFVWWKQTEHRTDLDLSLVQFDSGFEYMGHVSYTNLQAQGIVHSGDIQSAPQGAAEFIDVTLQALPPGVRYLAVQVHRFAGEQFCQMDTRAGWMVREKVDKAYKSFDIKTVANAFALQGRAAWCLPLVVDLEGQQIIVTDLYMGGAVRYNNVEGSKKDAAAVCRELVRLTETRPTMGTLVGLHLEARGAERAENKEDADITFGISDCDYNAGDVEVVLSELI